MKIMVVSPSKALVICEHRDFLPISQYKPSLLSPYVREIGSLVNKRTGEVYRRICVR